MSHINYIKCVYDFKYKAFYFHITKYLLNTQTLGLGQQWNELYAPEHRCCAPCELWWPPRRIFWCLYIYPRLWWTILDQRVHLRHTHPRQEETHGKPCLKDFLKRFHRPCTSARTTCEPCTDRMREAVHNVDGGPRPGWCQSCLDSFGNTASIDLPELTDSDSGVSLHVSL